MAHHKRRHALKAIDFARLYGAGTINQARLLGHYPLTEADYVDMELRVLAMWADSDFPPPYPIERNTP